jgi:hypothetical protein
VFILIPKEELPVIIRHRLIQHRDRLLRLEEVRQVFTSRQLIEARVILETITNRHLATQLTHLAEVQVLDRALLTQDLQLDLQAAVVVQVVLAHQAVEEDVVKILRK